MKKHPVKQFDFKLYYSSISLILLAILLYIVGNFLVPLDHIHIVVLLTEHFQSLFLLFMAFYSYRHARSVKQNSDSYDFWIWVVFWWLLLFGRGINWGRDFFPDVPRFYYKIIASVLIAIPVFSMVFIASIRREIKRRYLYEKIPVWFAFFAFLFLGIADVAEHQRIGYQYLVLNPLSTELIEEFMEVPCLLSLGLVVFYLCKNEQLKRSDKTT